MMAVNRAVGTLDDFMTTREFAHQQNPSDTNPCSGLPNSVSWVNGDGAGGLLALAAVCFESKKRKGEKYHRIAGFRIQFDQLDPWSTAPTARTTSTSRASKPTTSFAVPSDH